MFYDVIIVGAGPGGIFTAYELKKRAPEKKVAVFELGRELSRRKCPIDGEKVKSCVKCPVCSIMSGFGGAGAFSDGKYNITNQFGGTLYEYVGKQKAIELMRYVDEINLSHGGAGTKLYSTANTRIKRMCLENGLHLLDAFPVDVWIRRVLEREYPLGYPLERYRPYNGVYQQYMFYYCRNVVPDQYSL